LHDAYQVAGLLLEYDAPETVRAAEAFIANG
jgi:hypothetical protein